MSKGRTRSIVFLVLLIFLFSLTGCVKFPFLSKTKEEPIAEPPPVEPLAAPTNAEMRSVVVYYLDETGKFLVPYERQIPKVEGIAKATLALLINTNENFTYLKGLGLNPTIPAGTLIRGMTIRDGLAKVDFTQEFLNYQGMIRENLLIDSIIYTLTGFPNVEKVQFMVEGKILDALPEGTPVSKPLGRERGLNVENAAQTVSGTGLSRITLYFLENPAGGVNFYFVPVTRVVQKGNSLLETAVKELIKGPETGAGLSSPFPAECKVLGVEANNGVATVNLSEEVLVAKNSVAESAMIRSLVLTLTEFPEIKQVKLLINGRDAELTGSTTETPWIRPARINPIDL